MFFFCFLITDFVYALFDLVQPIFEWNVSWKVPKKGFLSPRKPWNLVFASPEKTFECLHDANVNEHEQIVSYCSVFNDNHAYLNCGHMWIVGDLYNKTRP